MIVGFSVGRYVLKMFLTSDTDLIKRDNPVMPTRTAERKEPTGLLIARGPFLSFGVPAFFFRQRVRIPHLVM